MAKFCVKCGAELEEGLKFCPKCGANQDEKVEAPKQSAPEAEKPQGATASLEGLSDANDVTAEMDPKDIADHKLHAICAYLGLLFLVPLLAAKDSKFARFHLNQGIVLAIGEMVFGIIGSFHGVIGWIGWALEVVCGVFALVGLIYACQGKAKRVPLFGKLKIFK